MSRRIPGPLDEPRRGPSNRTDSGTARVAPVEVTPPVSLPFPGPGARPAPAPAPAPVPAPAPAAPEGGACPPSAGLARLVAEARAARADLARERAAARETTRLLAAAADRQREHLELGRRLVTTLDRRIESLREQVRGLGEQAESVRAAEKRVREQAEVARADLAGQADEARKSLGGEAERLAALRGELDRLGEQARQTEQDASARLAEWRGRLDEAAGPAETRISAAADAALERLTRQADEVSAARRREDAEIREHVELWREQRSEAERYLDEVGEEFEQRATRAAESVQSWCDLLRDLLGTDQRPGPAEAGPGSARALLDALTGVAASAERTRTSLDAAVVSAERAGERAERARETGERTRERLEASGREATTAVTSARGELEDRLDAGGRRLREMEQAERRLRDLIEQLVSRCGAAETASESLTSGTERADAARARLGDVMDRLRPWAPLLVPSESTDPALPEAVERAVSVLESALDERVRTLAGTFRRLARDLEESDAVEIEGPAEDDAGGPGDDEAMRPD